MIMHDDSSLDNFAGGSPTYCCANPLGCHRRRVIDAKKNMYGSRFALFGIEIFEGRTSSDVILARMRDLRH